MRRLMTSASLLFALTGSPWVATPSGGQTTPASITPAPAHAIAARPLTDRRFEPTPARLERGRYLVEAVAHDDLKAIFAYLKTVPPVKHQVSNVGPPTACSRCGGTHGLGDRN